MQNSLLILGLVVIFMVTRQDPLTKKRFTGLKEPLLYSQYSSPGQAPSLGTSLGYLNTISRIAQECQSML